VSVFQLSNVIVAIMVNLVHFVMKMTLVLKLMDCAMLNE